MNAVALFDASGRLLEVDGALWARALNRAMANGWKPAGTAPPPRCWSAEGAVPEASHWDGRYQEAMGQCVAAGDAARLGQALARAAEQGGNAELARLAVFANSGSFLICRLTTELRDALRGMPNSEGAGLQRLPEELRLDLENLRRSIEGYSTARDREEADSKTPRR